MTILIDTLGIYRSTIDDMHDVQKEMAKVQKQISSGYRFDRYADMSEQGILENITSLEEIITGLKNYTNTNRFIKSRAEAADQILASLIDIMTNFASEVTVKIGAATENYAVATLAQSTLSQLEDNLNINFGGIYLFGGTNNSNPPVNNLVNNSNILNSTFTANYYAGDNNDIYLNISDNYSIKTNWKANNQAFIDAIGAVNQAIQAEKNGDNSLMIEASVNTQNAIQELINLRSEIRGTIVAVTQVDSYHLDMQTYLEDALAEYTVTDLPEASLKLASDTNILMATFQTFAKLSRLTLADYIR